MDAEHASVLTLLSMKSFHCRPVLLPFIQDIKATLGDARTPPKALGLSHFPIRVTTHRPAGRRLPE